MSQPACPKCHALETRRIRQEGFLQQSLLRRLGYYPWECRFCKSTFVLKDRGLGKGASTRGTLLEGSSAKAGKGMLGAD